MPKRLAPRKPSTRTRRKKSENIESAHDYVFNSDSENEDGEEVYDISQKQDYFSMKGESRKTSDKTLADLQEKLLDRSELSSLMETNQVKHQEEKKKLMKKYKKELFPQWFAQLQEGFSLFLYGFGSKKRLIELFARKYLSDSLTGVVLGFAPHVSIKSILDLIVFQVMGEKDMTFRTLSGQAEFIRSSFLDPFKKSLLPSRFFLVIHNIDGATLRSFVAQSLLASLADIPQFSLIASVDHVNAPSLWNHTMRQQFNWLWYHVTTYEMYSTEMQYEQPLMAQGNSEITANGLRFIFKSLTANAKGVFRVLAEHQLANPKEGLGYQLYFEKCREKFYVPSDLTMRTQLTEFRDHKVILTKSGPEGPLFFIPMTSSVLKQVLAEMDEGHEDAKDEE